MYQISTLYMLNVYNALCQLYINKKDKSDK